MSKKTVYTFPNAETVYAKLRSVSDLGSDVERHFRQFANSAGDSQKVANGVVIMWMYSVRDLVTRDGAPPMLSGILDWMFEDCMNALFEDNPAFAAEVIALYREVVTS